MKVVFVFGGVPHYYNKILNLIQSKEGVEVTVIAPLKNGSTLGKGVYQTKEGIDFKLLELQEYKTWYGKFFFKNFYSTMNALRPDIIVIGWPYFLNFILHRRAIRMLKKNGTKIISKEIPFSVPSLKESQKSFAARASFFQRKERIFTNPFSFWMVKWLRKKLYSSIFDGAVTYIKSGNAILHSYGLPLDKIVTTYNSISTEDIFNTLNKLNAEGINVKSAREDFHLIHVGRLVKWKRVDLLIEAVNKLKESFPQIKLTIVGNGPEMDSLKDLAEKLEVHARIEFTGAIYDTVELSKRFLAAKVYVLAGMGGLSINEAMCYSLPIVSSICDGTEEHLVFENRNGKIFESDNLDSLIAAIHYILEDKERSDQMGVESRKIVEFDINEHLVVERYHDCFISQVSH